MPEEPPSVLVVGDERGFADLYAAWLGGEYDTRVAYCGQEALETLEGAVDVVLLDRRTSGISGDEVLAEIDDRGFECRVAIVTVVEPDPGTLGLAFDGYLTTPVSQDDLLGLVETLLGWRQYDEAVIELFSLVSRRTAIEAHWSESELEESDVYRALVDRIRDTMTDADELADRLLDGAVDALFRQLATAERGGMDG